MSKSNNRKINREILPTVKDLHQQISEIVAGLSYLSETDAEIAAFSGNKTDTVTVEGLLSQIGITDRKVEEKGFDEFFAPLIKIQKWFGEDERKMTEKFVLLKELLQQNLIQKKVFRIGKVKIDIYIIGLDEYNILRGIQTKAIET